MPQLRQKRLQRQTQDGEIVAFDALEKLRAHPFQAVAAHAGKQTRSFGRQIAVEKTIAELAELRMEAVLLSERVDNTLKLIGDLYLARVHAAAARKVYLGDWDTAISRKLDIIGNLYELLVDRARNAQSHTLELVVIALILAEILIAVFTRL